MKIRIDAFRYLYSFKRILHCSSHKREAKDSKEEKLQRIKLCEMMYL